MSNETITFDEATLDEQLSFNECMLTTFDNPFDYFEQFTSWLMFDIEKGYYTCNVLARIAELADDMTQKERNDEFERAIDVIIKNDFMNIYKKVRRKDKTNNT